MSTLEIGLIGFGFLIILLICGMPIGLSMGLVGFLGFACIAGITPGLGVVRNTLYSTVASYTMSVVPLFMLMGQFAYYSGLSQDLFRAAYKWLGHFRGGLAMATIAGCAGFGAICGSSLATGATMCSVALPEMKRYNYDIKLATACIAAGGTLGILIPPSIIMVIYGILTEQSIGKLLIAGIVPGILLSSLFMVTIYIVCRIDPALGPSGPPVRLREKLGAVKNTWHTLCLFILVMGGIIFGLFTPTEAAAVGALGALLIALARGGLSRKNFTNCLLETGTMTGMAFIIVIGAMIFGYFLTVTKIPMLMAETIAGLQISKYVVLILVLLVYAVLGCLMDSFAMIVLTVPIFFPLIQSLGFDPIWFGVIMVIITEMGLITPPVGLNVYIISGMSNVPLETVFAGIWPYIIDMIIMLAILIVFPDIALFLPRLIK